MSSTALIVANDIDNGERPDSIDQRSDLPQHPDSDRAVLLLDEIHAKLEKIPTVENAMLVMAEADALRIFVRRAIKGFVAQNRCAYIKLLAQRRAGELLQDVPRAPMGGAQSARGEKHSHTYGEWLNGLGIHWETASRWQQLASLPAAVIKEQWELADAKGDELTEARVHSLVRQRRSAEREQYWEAEYPLQTAHDRDEKAVKRAYEWLSKRVDTFLRPGDESHRKLTTILADRTHVRPSEVDAMRTQFVSLRARIMAAVERITAACEELEQRIDAPMTEPVVEPIMSDADRDRLREAVRGIRR